MGHFSVFGVLTILFLGGDGEGVTFAPTGGFIQIKTGFYREATADFHLSKFMPGSEAIFMKRCVYSSQRIEKKTTFLKTTWDISVYHSAAQRDRVSLPVQINIKKL